MLSVYVSTLIFFAALIPVWGFVCWMSPPKKISAYRGYKTAMSRLNADTWQFANRLYGKLSVIFGSVWLLLCSLVVIPIENDAAINAMTSVVTAGSVLLVIAIVILTEVLLRRTFDREGNRK